MIQVRKPKRLCGADLSEAKDGSEPCGNVVAPDAVTCRDSHLCATPRILPEPPAASALGAVPAVFAIGGLDDLIPVP